MLSAWILLLSLLRLTASIPDVLPPGHHSVEHVLILTMAEETPSYRFVAYPVRGFHGSHEIQPGEPFTFSSKYGTRIYAVPRDTDFPADRDAVAAVD